MDSSKSKRVVLYCRVATQAQLDGDHTLAFIAIHDLTSVQILPTKR